MLNILRRLGVTRECIVFKKGRTTSSPAGLAIENRGGKLLAEMGIVSGKLQKQFGIDEPVYFADLNWTQLMKAVQKKKVTYTEISKFPAVSRDLALLVDEGVEFAQIEEVAYKSEKKLLKAVTLFDVYEGKNLPQGKKSYAVNFILQDERRPSTTSRSTPSCRNSSRTSRSNWAQNFDNLTIGQFQRR